MDPPLINFIITGNKIDSRVINNMTYLACISGYSSIEFDLEVWIDIHHAERLSQIIPHGVIRRRVFTKIFFTWKQNDQGHHWQDRCR